MSVPVNQAIWGDARIDVYRHVNKYRGTSLFGSKKRHLCYACIHTNFYGGGQTEITFPKRKLDIQSKDKANRSTDANFALTMHISPPEVQVSMLIHLEMEMRNLFLKHGTRRSIPKGDVYRLNAENHHPIVLVLQGTLDGFVDEVAEEGKVLGHHPLGACVDAVAKDGGRGGESVRRRRRPNILVAGQDSVIGASLFLSEAACTDFEARTHCEVVELYKTTEVFSKIGRLKTPGSSQSIVGRVQIALARNKNRVRDGVDINIPGMCARKKIILY